MNIDADNELTGIERAHLAQWLTEDSFKIVQKLMEDQIKKFNLDLVNASKTEDIIVKHNLAKSAAQFYQMLIERISQEVLIYTQAPKSTDKPKDVTESILDLDDIAAAMSEVPNLLELEG
jgi:hypothetical protein